MKTLQILQGQFAGFHFLIYFLKPTRELIFLISKVICSQILDPKYDADSLPLHTLWIGSTGNYKVFMPQVVMCVFS